MSQKLGYIYALQDPRVEQARYIGKTTNPQARLNGHVATRTLSERTHKANWIKSLLADDVKPEMKVLAAYHIDDLDEMEMQFIAHYRQHVKLTNLHDGGTGGAMPPAIAKAAGLKRRGRKSTPETRALISKASKERCADPVERARLRSIATSAPPIFMGTDNKQSKLTENDVKEMRRLRNEGCDLSLIAEKFNVTEANVSSIVTGKTWKHVAGPIQKVQQHQRLSDQDVRDIRRLSTEGVANCEIAIRFDIDQSHVSKIISRRARKSVV